MAWLIRVAVGCLKKVTGHFFGPDEVARSRYDIDTWGRD